MPQQDAAAFRGGIEFPDGFRQATISVRYNDANNVINRWHWNVPAGVTVEVRLFDKVSGDLVFSDTKVGPDVDDAVVPGNSRMVEITDDGDPYLDLPWDYQFTVRPTAA